ncbi:MAG: NAD(P)/FAD-dependent oxidoreductase, partial [Alphaproteobacteria bacterium]|nr:NAD(P)/FAD-dependent oxidoreductase [Alphaproteobacteria bacterium]
HRAITQMAWYRDLDLERHGATYIEPELNVALLLKDGRSLQWWTDFERTHDSFAAMSEKDAATLKRWHDDFRPIVENILIPEAMTPPLPPDERRRLLERTPEGRLLLEVSALSPLEFVAREFEHPTIQAGLLFFNGLREVDLRVRGFGHHIAALLASTAKAQMTVGGARALAHALEAAVAESGGTVLTNAEPKRILVENDRAVGVETTDGAVHMARHFVASGLNPHQTFLDLLAPEDLPGEWRSKVENFQYNVIAPLFALNLNLDSPPVYSAAEADPALSKPFMVILGLEHFEQYPEIVRHHEAGTIPPTVMWGACPTQFDPSQAPAGKHTAFMWEKLPYHLGGDPKQWDRVKDEHGQVMLDLWSEYAPGLRDQVIGSFTRSALDVERTFPNMREGDLLIGAFTNGQIGYNRPFAGAGHYRTHLPGLYLCGSCCHPGGNITGLPGYNAAQVVLSDLGIDADWAPAPIADRLAAFAARAA